ncbi:MAG: hypothetical protein LBI18_03660 [Planctomycetaceae bacterium]|jgi:hypothetical protein|nr:hypothetical protein [Planctomycetaceae bacterium]
MKNGTRLFRFMILVFFFGVLFVGCKSRENNQLSNPFALHRQTAPPPATFSHQAAYLGQTPSTYVPQLPATTYPAGHDQSIPANVPLPSGTVPSSPVPAATAPSGSYGSINNSGGATLFPTSATLPTAAIVPETIPSTTTENGWTVGDTTAANTITTNATTTDIPADIAATGETIFQNLESKSHLAKTVDTSGVVSISVAEPETWAVSSSQLMTQIVDDSAPQSVPAESQSVYAGKYQ